jgi:hypothetical protein
LSPETAAAEGLFRLLALWAEPPAGAISTDETEKGVDHEEEVPHPVVLTREPSHA